MKIEYFASNTTMGGTSDGAANQYRAWAESELRAKYPDANIEVSADESLTTCIVDVSDLPASDQINTWADISEYCARLWDRCPWTGEYFS